MVLTLVFVFVLLHGVPLQDLGGVFRRADWRLITLAALGMVAKNIFGAWRWRALLGASGCEVGLGELTRIYLVGWFYGNFLPTQIGGDVARGLYLNRVAPGFVQVNIVAMLVERVIGLVTLGMFATVGLWLFHGQLPGWLQTGVLAFGTLSLAGGAALFWVPFERLIEWPLRHWFPERAATLVDGLQAMGRFRHPVLLVQVFAATILFQLAAVLCVYLAGRAVGADVPLVSYAVFISLSFVAGMLPVTLNGYGIRENVLARLLTAYAGVSEQTATAIALLFALLLTLRAASGGVALLLWPERKRPDRLRE